MKKVKYTLCLLLLSATLWARMYGVDDSRLDLDDATSFVCDPEGIISPDSVAVINQLVARLQDSTSIEVRVVVVDSVVDGNCFQFATDLFNKYGVGKKELDNGLVILLSTGDRCVHFVTGYGLEGDLPDVNCVRLQRRYMNTYFGNGEWDAGLVSGVRAVRSYLHGNSSVVAEEE